MKFLQQKGLGLKDEFLRETGLMFTGTTLYNIFGLLYHLFMVRGLEPVEYGSLNTLLALFMVIQVPSSTVQTTVTKFVSYFRVSEGYEKIQGLLRNLFSHMFLAGLLLFVVFGLGSSLISSALQLHSRWSVILLGALLFLVMIIPVPWGGLQGLQKFWFLNVNLFLNGLLKFGLGMLFVLLGWGVVGALGAVALSYLLNVVISFFMLQRSLPRQTDCRGGFAETTLSSAGFGEVFRDFLPVGLSLACFMLLTNVDLILVKHYFQPIEAGYYSIGQMVGKVLLFTCFPVAIVMFPKVASLAPQSAESYEILMKSLKIVGALCLIGICSVFFFPGLILQILSGEPYPQCIPLVRLFSVSMGLFSLTYILLLYHLSNLRRNIMPFVMVFFVLVLVAGIVKFHMSLTVVLTWVCVTSGGVFAANLYLACRSGGRRA